MSELPACITNSTKLRHLIATCDQLSPLAAQWSHFAAWPVLGTGIILACMPSHDQMAEQLRQSGLADKKQQAAASSAAADQLAAIRKVAGDSRPWKPSL